MSGAPSAVNVRESTIASILGSMPSMPRMPSVGAISSYGQMASYVPSAESGNYTLQVLFYLCLYMFIIFLCLILVHFAVTPVFKFTPGAKGLIGLPSATDDRVYWNTKKQQLPDEKSRSPLLTDDLATYPFDTDFSFSVDLYVRRITDADSSNKRVILYKTFTYGNDLTPKIQSSGTAGTGATSESYALADVPAGVTLESHMKTKCSMYMYLSDTNNLGVTFFVGSPATAYSIREVKNIPLYTPFRVTVTVEDRTITVYINGKQTFQRITPGKIGLNTDLMIKNNQSFYTSPAWAMTPNQTVFLQNLHIWPRVISYAEIQRAQPALALPSDFGMPAEIGTDKCT